MLDVAGALLLAFAVVSGAVLHKRALERRDRAGLLASASCLTAALALALVAVVDDARFRALSQEDGPAEWATVVAFTLAAVLFGKRALAPRPPWLTKTAFLFLALLCAFVAGEEISWGQRLFALEPPAIFLEHNFQQELNLHNLLTQRSAGGVQLDTRFFVALLAASYGGLLPRVRARLSRSRYALLQAAGASAPPALLSSSFLLVAAAELSYPVALTGEAAELVLGLCFLAASALSTTAPRSLTAPALLGAACALGLLLPVVVDRLLYGSDVERVVTARAELGLLASDLEREGVLSRRRLSRKKSVHKRVFTATRAGYLRFSDESAFLEHQRTPAESDDEGRSDRRGFFLDPWHNPYWIVWSKEQQRLTLYSFGPDRRRNGAYQKDASGEGDDVVVQLKPPWQSDHRE